MLLGWTSEFQFSQGWEGGGARLGFNRGPQGAHVI